MFGYGNEDEFNIKVLKIKFNMDNDDHKKVYDILNGIHLNNRCDYLVEKILGVECVSNDEKKEERVVSRGDNSDRLYEIIYKLIDCIKDDKKVVNVNVNGVGGVVGSGSTTSKGESNRGEMLVSMKKEVKDIDFNGIEVSSAGGEVEDIDYDKIIDNIFNDNIKSLDKK